MAKILNDTEIKKLIKHNIIKGDEACIRSNAYILRLGAKGEYTHIGKEFDISGVKKGFKLPTGNSVAIISYEQIDFRRETVHQLYPKCDLFAYMSPITDLSREGIATHTTVIDSGYHGVINWTFNNTSNKENEFIYKENLYKLVVFKLEGGEEIPEHPYQGNYQNQTGIVRSKRQGAPKGMRENEWESPINEKSPEKHLEHLINSGYPWSILGERLKTLDGQLITITNEYSKIDDSINKLADEVHSIPEKIDKAIKNKQSDWIINIAIMIGAFSGLFLTLLTTDITYKFMNKYGGVIGVVVLMGALFVLFMNRKK